MQFAKCVRMQRAFVFVILGLLPLRLSAVNYQWISNTNSSWNIATNWSPNGIPNGAADKVFFNGGGSGNCMLDANRTIGYLEMSGYAGQFIQGGFTLNITPAATASDALTINGGSYLGGSGTLTVVGNFDLSSGSFTCPLTYFYFQGDTFRQSGGIFSHNNGKTQLKISNTYGGVPVNGGIMNLFSNSNTTFFKLEFFTYVNVINYYYINDNITVMDTCWKSGTTNRIYGANDSIFLKGNLMINYNSSQGYGDVNFVFNDVDSQYLVGRLPGYSDSWVESVVVDKPSGTLKLINHIMVGPNWHYKNRAGTIDPGTSIVFFNGSGFIRGTFALNKVRIQGSGPGSLRTVYDTLTVNGYLDITGDNYADLYQGYVRALGDVYMSAASAGVDYCLGDAYIWINGTLDQVLDSDVRRNRGYFPNIIIDKPSGLLTMKDTINVERNWIYRRGNVDAISFNSYVHMVEHDPVPAINTANPSWVYYIDGSEGSDYMLFNKVELQFDRRLGGDVHVKNQLVLNNNLLALNGYDVYIENPATNIIQRGANGFIISETSSPPSSIYWYIDNASSGTTYTFPFAAITTTPTLTYPTVFFDLSVQTAGTPTVGDTGWIAVGTYPTDPLPAANNRPFPPGVTNINNIIGLDNSPRELDRFWVYDCGNYTTTPTVTMTFRYLDREWSGGSNDITESLLRPHQWNGTTWSSASGGSVNTSTNTSIKSGITSCSAFTLVDTTQFIQLIFHATDTNVCAGESVQFIDDNLTQPTSRQWYFPGGTPSTSTAASPTVTYNSIGCYNAILWSNYPGRLIKDTLYCYIQVGNAFSISTSHTNVSCYGDSNGTAGVTASPPGAYRYTWADGPIATSNRTGLAPGTYYVTVADTSATGGCDRTDSIVISEPDSLTITIDNVVDAACTCDGRARANVSGGTGPYSYQWDSSGTAQTSTTLCPGLRSVTVTDANGCTISDTVSINSNSNPLLANIDSVKNVTCNGACNGTARVAATGGSGSYGYSWDCLGQTTPTAITLCGGPCTVTVTDISNGCSVTATANVFEPAPLVVTVLGYDPSAVGLNDGSVRAIATGGTIPYFPFTHGPSPCVPPCQINSVLWPQDSLSNLGPGEICFTVYDANLCFDASCDTLVDPFPPLVLTTGKTDVACSGVCNGTAWVSVTGGSGAYTYSWSAGTNPTNDTVTGLCQGVVTITVSDLGGGGTATASVTINQPAGQPINYSLNIQIPSCNGSSDGSAWVSGVSGGVPPYDYLWSRGTNPTNDTVTGLSAGDVYLMIEDDAGCKVYDTITITEPAAVTISQTITSVTCPGGSNGAISLSASGGIGFGYGYLWSNGANTSNITNIPEGFYSVIVNDGVGCTATESYTVRVSNRFEISANVVNASCGVDNGFIDLTAQGSGSYTYSWSNGLPPTEDAVALLPGRYTVSVTDNGTGCSQNLTSTVESAGGPDITGSITDATDCSSTDGSISVTVNPAGAYTYSWSHGAFFTPAVSGLSRGSYSVTVTDTSSSCVSISTFEVGVVNEISFSAAITDATCNSTNGAISVTVLTGSGGYTYTWSNGASTASIANVGFGTYGITVNDSRGCSGDSLFTVSEGGPSISGTVTDVTCFGGNNGAINITVSGTNTYVWSTGTVSQNITGLTPGIYSVTVNANTQCSSAKVFTVREPNALSLTVDISGISCFGADDGWIDLSVSGGNPTYTYSWTSTGFNASVQDISNLAPGTYNVTTTDSKSCVSSLSFLEITEPSALVLTIDTVNVSCGGLSDGQASVSVTGGVVPYSYLWSAGSPNDNDTVINLPTGPIGVTVTDANNCTATESSAISQQPPLVLSLSKTDISCFGLTDGEATVSVSGGTPGYVYIWNNGTPQPPDNSTVTDLGAGYVAVTVVDIKNCAESDSILIVEPLLLTTSINSDSVNCFGASDGGATVTPSGGTSPYTYTWSAGTPQASDSIVGGLQAGNVQVTVTDFRGCTALDTTVVFEPSALVLTMDSTNNICADGINGTATVTVNGGTPNYTYTWSPVGQPGGTPNVRIQLPVGLVSVTVNDAKNCSETAGVNIKSPPAISIALNQINISCFGENDGKAFVTASGGAPGYTYLWSSGTPPLILDSVTGLSAGNVTVTVTDSLGCTTDSFVNIIEPSEIVLVMDSVNISCFGQTDGQASVTASGGTPGPGFTYSWNTGDLTPSISGLAAGIKSVTVTDSRSCTNSDSVNIIEPTQIVITSITPTHVSCFGGNNGTAVVVASGGTPSQPGAAGYTYTWTSGTPVPPNDRVTGLSQGIISVIVNDSRGCPEDTSAIINQPPDSISTIISATNVSCFGGNDGTASVIATGGTPGYTYSWSKGVPGNTPTTTQLNVGLVSVVVTDSNGCIKSDDITLTEPTDLLLTILVDSNTNCYGGTTGGLTVSATGGTPSYSYSWSTTPPQTSPTIDGLGVGNYNVTVTDSNNCIKQISENIVERPGPQLDSITGIAPVRPTCDNSNGSITLNVTTLDPELTYVWNPAVSTGNSATGLAEGTYNVTVTDASACDTMLSITLIDIPGPTVDFEKIKDSYCDDNDGRATAIVTGGTPAYTFTWVDENSVVLSNNDTIKGLVEGLYSLVVADANACDTQINFGITNIASPNAQILPVSPQVVYVGQVVNLTATSDIPGSLFTWDPTRALTCGSTACDTLTANPAETVTYRLIVSDPLTDCTDTAYMTIIVKDEDNIFVPNVITPNGDGINDYWNITDLLEVFPDNEVAIVNRWGDEVFRAKNYGSASTNWDGFYKGEKLPDGTYYYIIILNNIGKSVSGPVTIISE